jgi:hypothetical protein
MRSLTLLFKVMIIFHGLRALASPNELRLLPEEQKALLEGPFLTWDLKKDQMGGWDLSSKKIYISTEKILNGYRVQAVVPEKMNGTARLFLVDGDDRILSDESVDISEGRFSREILVSPSLNVAIRSCIFQIRDLYDVQICSQSINLHDQKTRISPRVAVAGGKASFKEVRKLEPGKRILITATNSKGMSFQWNVLPPSVELFEAYPGSTDDWILRFTGPSPAMDAQPLKPQRSEIIRPTIGDLREIYEARVPQSAPILGFDAGLIFTYSLRASRTVKKSSTFVISEGAPRSTYLSEVRLRGHKSVDEQVSSSQNSTETTSNSKDWLWNYAAENTGQINRSRISLVSKKTQTVYDFEIYRGLSTYLSAGIGLSLSSRKEIGIFSDLQAAHWFSEPFGENYWLSRNRWGIAMGHVATAVSSVPDSKYQMRTFNLRYRLTPGVTGWDETFGLSTGLLELSYLESRPARWASVGAFWSRSLPEWFNYIFGFFPFFRKPKWVKIEALAFGHSLDAKIHGNAVQLRGTGRIDISQAFYFEGGWAIFSTSYQDMQDRKQIDLSVGRGFLGLGYRF